MLEKTQSMMPLCLVITQGLLRASFNNRMVRYACRLVFALCLGHATLVMAQDTSPAPNALGSATAIANTANTASSKDGLATHSGTPMVQLVDMEVVQKALNTQTLYIELLVMVFAGGLVFFMQLGFAFLESGMSRTKNTVNVLMKNFCDLCVGSVVFWCVGYGLMYGANSSGWVGTTHFFPTQISLKESGVLFFQIMFAAAAATIVSGAIAERTRFSAYLIGSAVICGFIYPVVGSWVWGSNHGGQGWLKAMGFIDFAGSSVVHSVGGWCALAALIVVKPRLGKYAADGTPRLIQGHSLSNVVLGTLVLWVGWFGFNAGSAATLEGSTLQDMGKIALNTHLAGCTGALAAMIAMLTLRKKIMLSVTLNGAIGGLVAVTAGSAVMDAQWALFTGLVAGFLITYLQPQFDYVKLDDVVGAVSVHLVGGIWGTLAAGLFGAKHFLSPTQLYVQMIGVLAIGVFSFVTAYITYRVIDAFHGMRVTVLEEQRGLDIAEHAEVGYPEFQHQQLHSGAAAAQSQG